MAAILADDILKCIFLKENYCIQIPLQPTWQVSRLFAVCLKKHLNKQCIDRWNAMHLHSHIITVNEKRKWHILSITARSNCPRWWVYVTGQRAWHADTWFESVDNDLWRGNLSSISLHAWLVTMNRLHVLAAWPHTENSRPAACIDRYHSLLPQYLQNV